MRPTVKVAGRWAYLYRAIDQFSQVIDVLVSEKRDQAATRQCFRSAPESNPSTYILARRRDSTCANRPATSANMSSNPARHRSRRSSAVAAGAAIALSFRHITPKVDHAVTVSVVTTRRPRSHPAAAVLAERFEAHGTPPDGGGLPDARLAE